MNVGVKPVWPSSLETALSWWWELLISRGEAVGRGQPGGERYDGPVHPHYSLLAPAESLWTHNSPESMFLVWFLYNIPGDALGHNCTQKQGQTCFSNSMQQLHLQTQNPDIFLRLEKIFNWIQIYLNKCIQSIRKFIKFKNICFRLE